MSIDEQQEAATAASGGRGGRKPYLVAAVVLLVVALAAAGVFGVRWALAATDDDAQYAGARDDVLRVGEQMAINLTSPDYKHLDQFKQRLADSTTGKLHDNIGKVIDKNRQRFAKQKLSARSELVEGAVTDLDTHANTAKVLVVVKTTKQGVDPKKNPPQQLPVVIGLTRQDENADWKANSVSQAPQ